MTGVARNVDHYTSRLPSLDRVGQLQVEIDKFDEAAIKLQAQADRAEIVDEESYGKGGDLIRIANSYATQAEDLRKELSAPFYNMHKFINSVFKPVNDKFGNVRKTIERKMVIWKRAEDARRRMEAEAKAKALEDAALQAAEHASGEEQQKILDIAATMSQETLERGKVGLVRGHYGSTTGTAKRYRTEVKSMSNFLAALPRMVEGLDIRLEEIVEFRKSGMNKLAKLMLERGILAGGGAEFIEEEALRVR